MTSATTSTTSKQSTYASEVDSKMNQQPAIDRMISYMRHESLEKVEEIKTKAAEEAKRDRVGLDCTRN